MKTALAYIIQFVLTITATKAYNLNLTETQGEFKIFDLVTEPNQDISIIGTYFALSGYTEIESYIGEYTKVNDGTNVTKALVMLSRILNGGMRFPWQDEVNSTAASIGAEYMLELNMDLKCNELDGNDADLCRAIQKTSPGPPPYPNLESETGESLYRVYCSSRHNQMSPFDCYGLAIRLKYSRAILPTAPRCLVQGGCFISWSKELYQVTQEELYKSSYDIINSCVYSHSSGRAIDTYLGGVRVTVCVSDRATGCK